MKIVIPKFVYLHLAGIKKIEFKKISLFIQQAFGLNTKINKAKEEIVKTKGIILDLLNTNKTFGNLGFLKQDCHILITNRIFSTPDTDSRLHIRAAVYGYPSIISLSGIVEGPAKPREFYLYKKKFSSIGTWALEEPNIKKEFKGRFIDYDDVRLTDVLKGYISQAIFFYLIQEPFCQNKGCRLFNAHWQEDLINSQIKSAKFCARHKKILENIKEQHIKKGQMKTQSVNCGVVAPPRKPRKNFLRPSGISLEIPRT